MSPNWNGRWAFHPTILLAALLNKYLLRITTGAVLKHVVAKRSKPRKTVHRAVDYGERTYWTRVIPEVGPDGLVDSVMTISQDVTDRVRVERELMQLTAQLFRIQDDERRALLASCMMKRRKTFTAFRSIWLSSVD
jgi:hypothetical protein